MGPRVVCPNPAEKTPLRERYFSRYPSPVPRKRKPWNADLKIPGLLGEPETPTPKPFPGTISPSHSTPGGPEIECLRCERLKLGNDVTGLDHTPSCPWRGKGDPAVG
jgi:hypothetical protein